MVHQKKLPPRTFVVGESLVHNARLIGCRIATQQHSTIETTGSTFVSNLSCCWFLQCRIWTRTETALFTQHIYSLELIIAVFAKRKDVLTCPCSAMRAGRVLSPRFRAFGTLPASSGALEAEERRTHSQKLVKLLAASRCIQSEPSRRSLSAAADSAL